VNCAKCGAEILEDEVYEHAGETLCEDCYLDVKASPKVCDPWAVYTAKKEAKGRPALTPLQERIVALLKQKGPISLEEICQELGIDEVEFKSNFAPLRHMELARAVKVGKEVKYTTF